MASNKKSSINIAQNKKELYVGLPLMKSYDVREFLSDESTKSSRNRLLDHLKSSKYGQLKYDQPEKCLFEYQPDHKSYAPLEKSNQLKNVLLTTEEVFTENMRKIIEIFLRHQGRKKLLLASIAYVKKLCEIQETIIGYLQRLPANISKDMDLVLEDLNKTMKTWYLEINSFERETACQNRSTNLQTLYPLADLASMQSCFDSSTNTSVSGTNIITYVFYFILNLLLYLLGWDVSRRDEQRERMSLEAKAVAEDREVERKSEVLIEQMLENLKDFIDVSAKTIKEIRSCPWDMFFGPKLGHFLIKYNKMRYEMMQLIIRVSKSDFEEDKMHKAARIVDCLENLILELVQAIGAFTHKDEKLAERTENSEVKLLSWRDPVEIQKVADESLIARKPTLEVKRKEEKLEIEEIEDLVADLSLWQSFYAQKVLEKEDELSKVFAEARIDNKILAFKTKIEEEEKQFAAECKSREDETKLRREVQDRQMQLVQFEAEKKTCEYKECCDKKWETLMVSVKTELRAKEAEILIKEDLRKKEEEDRRRKDEEYIQYKKQILEQQAAFGSCFKQISEIIKSCSNKKLLEASVIPLLAKFDDLKKQMVQEAAKARDQNLAKEAAEKSSLVATMANDTLEEIRKAFEKANIEAEKSTEAAIVPSVKAQTAQESNQKKELLPPGTLASKNEAPVSPQSTELFHRNAQEYLKKYEDIVSKLCEDDKTTHIRDNIKKFIQTILNTITPSDLRGFGEKLEKLRRLLAGKSVAAQMDKMFSVPSFLAPHAILTLAEKLLKRGEVNEPESALMYAKLITSLMSDYPEFKEVMVATFYRTCPFLVPFCPSQLEGQSNEDYYRCLGYRCKDGKIEEQNKFLKRMEGVSRVYFSLFICPNQNVMPLSMALQWIVFIIEREPELDITATLLNVNLEVCCPKLLQVQSKTTIDLLTYLAERYLPRIKAVTPEGQGGPIQRLELLLGKNLKGQRR